MNHERYTLSDAQAAEVPEKLRSGYRALALDDVPVRH